MQINILLHKIAKIIFILFGILIFSKQFYCINTGTPLVDGAVGDFIMVFVAIYFADVDMRKKSFGFSGKLIPFILAFNGMTQSLNYNQILRQVVPQGVVATFHHPSPIQIIALLNTIQGIMTLGIGLCLYFAIHYAGKYQLTKKDEQE